MVLRTRSKLPNGCEKGFAQCQEVSWTPSDRGRGLPESHDLVVSAANAAKSSTYVGEQRTLIPFFLPSLSLA